MMDRSSSPVQAALLGLAVGDALGVPVEFKPRTALQQDPVSGMRGYGTHRQPPGTWSDDSSMAFCLAESLTTGYDLADIARRFVRWKDDAYWTPHGEVFDIGITTRSSLQHLRQILDGGDLQQLFHLSNDDESGNGNGALMRCLPLAFYLQGMPPGQQFRIIFEVSALTHRHIRSALACFHYLQMAAHFLDGQDKMTAYHQANEALRALLEERGAGQREFAEFARVLSGHIGEEPEATIRSGGYVMDSLEASLWCLLRHDDYPSTVLAAVNLGHDTDTTAAIAGGLAGLLYGRAGIPDDWINTLARLPDILDLATRLAGKWKDRAAH